MKTIIPIWEFNDIQSKKYEEALNVWRNDNGQIFYPSKYLYFFMTKKGYIQRHGYVLTDMNQSHQYAKTKKELKRWNNLTKGGK